MAKAIEEIRTGKVRHMVRVRRKKVSLGKRIFRFVMKELDISTYEEFSTFVKNSLIYVGGAAGLGFLFLFFYHALWFIAH